MTKKVAWTIYVTEEEKEAIKYFCTFHEMDIEKNVESGAKSSENPTQLPVTDTCDRYL